MNIADQIFLYAAEEQSISRAAERAFVSQQCASKHIQNLESQYGTPLILRRPHFMLTEAGTALFHTLQHVHMLEAGVGERIRELRQGEAGHLTLGINSSRVRLLLPPVLAGYRRICPHVRITIQSDDAVRLANGMLQGDIDMAVSVNAAGDSRFRITHLLSESIYFMATRRLLREYAPGLLQRELPEQLPIQAAAQIPLCMNLPGSTLADTLARCAARQNIVLEPVLRCSDYLIQLELCRSGTAGFFCPGSLMPPDACRPDSKNTGDDTPLYFRVPELQERLHTDLIRPVGAVQPEYMRRFAQKIQNYYSELRIGEEE